MIAQGIFATPVQPARATGLLGFDIGVAATAVHVDTNAAYWINSVPGGSDFVHNNYAAAPRLVVAKGFGFGTVSVSYAQFSSDVKTYGGTLDLPIIRGTVATPEIAARATYAQLSGVDVFKLKAYGLEAFISKGFGPLMPYAAYGRMRSDSSGDITATHTLHDQGENNRWTLGLRFSLFIPKFAIEATQAQERSYSAKISFGF